MYNGIGMKRTPEEKQQRKLLDQKKNQEYQQFYSENLSLIQICKYCKDPKQLREFVQNYQFRQICKECHKKKIKRWRKDNPEREKRMHKKTAQRSYKYIREEKLNKSCSKCGKIYPQCVMDFNHLQLNTKVANISKLYEKKISRIQTEIAKCELICANCHRDETFTRETEIDTNKNRIYKPKINEIPILLASDPVKFCAKCQTSKHVNNFTLLKTGYRHSYCKTCLRQYNNNLDRKLRTSKAYIISQKDNKQCTDCKRNFRYWILDFDHLENKTFSINKIQNRSLNFIKQEIAKCELVCANCHRIRTEIRKRLNKQITKTKINYTQINFSLDQILIRSNPDPKMTRIFLEKYHYAQYGRTAKIYYGVYLDNKLIAICKFSPVVRKEVATSMGYTVSQVLELDRFCIHPEYQKKNLASKILGQVIKLIKSSHPEIQILVSFADTMQGHEGTIYKASNWKYEKLTSTSHVYLDINGNQINKKWVYNEGKKIGLTELEYANQMNLIKMKIPEKHKFSYKLN